jgi:hypothetical protein
MTGAPLSTRVIALSIVEFSRRTIWCRVRRGTVADTTAVNHGFARVKV